MSRVKNGGSRSVLIIEDSYIQAYALRKMLESTGFSRIIICRSTQGLSERIYMEHPDMVFISTELRQDEAGISQVCNEYGISLIQQVRKQFHNPVVFMVNRGERFSLKQMQAVRNSGILFKPFRRQKLYEVVDRLLQKNPSNLKKPGFLEWVLPAL